MSGKVFLIGAGPSDAGLLTCKARDILQSADVVVYDALVGEAILAMVPPEAECINVGKRARNHTRSQWQINEILLEEAQKGKRVVRLRAATRFSLAGAVRNWSCWPKTRSPLRLCRASPRPLPSPPTTASP